MTTKMKGLFKGFRYISQIFDEEKEQEIQIGKPTDVKHVAHIGWDGPAVETPSWMKDFKGTGFQSAPLGSPGEGDARDANEVKWVSEDSKRGQRASSSQQNSQPRNLPDVPKSSRRQTSGDNGSNEGSGSMRRDSATKSRHRRQQNKDSSESGSRTGQESGLPNIPKKSRRKKSKELVEGGSSTRSRSKANTSTDTNLSQLSESESGHDPVLQSSSSQLSTSLGIDEEKMENRAISKK